MKFSQIKIGERFVWDGEIYVKSSPLIANHAETGADKMVPKYVNVQLAEARSGASNDINTPEAMLNYVVNELTGATNASSLSDADKALVLDEIDRVNRTAMKKLK